MPALPTVVFDDSNEPHYVDRYDPSNALPARPLLAINGNKTVAECWMHVYAATDGHFVPVRYKGQRAGLSIHGSQLRLHLRYNPEGSISKKHVGAMCFKTYDMNTEPNEYV